MTTPGNFFKITQPVTTADDILKTSQQGKIAKFDALKAAETLTPSSNALPALSGQALGAISNLRSINLPEPASSLTSGVPTAGNMRAVAKAAETAAQAEIDNVIYDTYKTSIFDPIVSIAKAGQYTYDVQLDTAQQTQLTPFLVKNGYKLISIVNSNKYNLRISWSTSADTTPINGGV